MHKNFNPKRTLKKKRLLALLAAALMLVPFAACANDDTPDTTDTTLSSENTNSPATTSPEPTGPVPELPDLKFEGAELIFVNRPADAEYYNKLWLVAEDITGYLINDSIWRRNTYLY